MKKVSPLIFINKLYFILTLMSIIVFAIFIQVDNLVMSSYIGATFGLMASSFLPYGRETAMLPLRRDIAYAASLKAQKLIAASFIGTYGTIMFIKRIFGFIELSYVHILFSIELIFISVMLFMYAAHLFSKRISKIKVINFVAWVIIYLLSMALGAGIAVLIMIIYSEKIIIPDFIAIIGIPISIILYLFVDQFRYKVGIKAVLDYDYAPGNPYKLLKFSLYEYEKLQYKRKEREHGCSNR